MIDDQEYPVYSVRFFLMQGGNKSNENQIFSDPNRKQSGENKLVEFGKQKTDLEKRKMLLVTKTHQIQTKTDIIM